MEKVYHPFKNNHKSSLQKFNVKFFSKIFMEIPVNGVFSVVYTNQGKKNNIFWENFIH